MSKEAMTLAHEALALRDTLRAEMILKEALAKQEGQSNFCPQCEALARELKAVKQEQGEPVAWRNAAIRVGEDLCSVGPHGYYDMTAEQWLDWALSVVTVHLPPQQRTWVGLTDAEIAGFAKTMERCNFLVAIYDIEKKLKEKNT
jgi:hypothetical protein